jgi:uncharacterized protein YxjI
MRFLMRQKIFALGDDFTIKDENANDVYFVDGRALSLGHKLSFQDMQGRELAFIKQRLLSWGPTYEIYVNGEVQAVIKKELFTFFRCKFTVDVPGPNDLEATGDFLDHEYAFERNGQTVAYVSKQWFSWSDTYGIEVLDPGDAPLVLISAIVIDLACHEKKD